MSETPIEFDGHDPEDPPKSEHGDPVDPKTENPHATELKNDVLPGEDEDSEVLY